MKNKIVMLLAAALLTGGLIIGLTAHAQPAPAPERHPAIRVPSCHSNQPGFI